MVVRAGCLVVLAQRQEQSHVVLYWWLQSILYSNRMLYHKKADVSTAIALMKTAE